MNRSRAAVTLLETVVAFGLLALAGLGLMALASVGLRMKAVGQERVQATEVGSELLERIRAQGYLMIPPGKVFDGRESDPPTEGFPPAPYPFREDSPGFVLQVETFQVRPSLRQVNVTVHSSRTFTRLESYFHP